MDWNDVYIVDTSLRDGEQQAGIALGVKEKVEIAALLDRLGIYQIEAGTPAMGQDEKRSIVKMMELNLDSKVSTWNRMNIHDLQHSIDCGVDIIHISVPASDIHIKSKLNKDRTWVIENMKKCISFVKEKGFEITIGLEDASRADFLFVMDICKAALELGVKRARYADTVGILYPKRIFEEIKEICGALEMDMGIHVHNDMGMAVANSIAAVQGGAKYIDCTIGGIGERAGNCSYIQFIQALEAMKTEGGSTDIEQLKKIEQEILTILKH
ncbi:homocitrate synthase [Petroclostridium sp. X23]|uniref:homocitrate synthase n=1 Tax=Petroclostridium sp. X23 TaxID=3045146 RepID=UPI0024AE63A5|nr:homocitrate synthase [Petroclostridium sp. X23]WHH56957.1 homocitrate synthase [Petroclostridium sp. X23]